MTFNSKEEELAYYLAESEKYYNYEQAIKLTLNSIYGAFGNNHFAFFNVDIAESITLTGKDAILYTEKVINNYFSNFWHLDKEAHTKLGITVTGKITKPVGIYIDTDSNYMTFEEVLAKCEGWKGTGKEFILKLYEVRLSGFIEKVLQKYADANNSNNYLSFELESVADTAIWLAKKKYLQNITWNDPNIHYAPLTKISVKGFEIVQSSTPLFARNKLKELITFILASPDLNIKEIAHKLKDIKREFKLASIDQICFSKKINNYQKYIVNDYDDFTIGHKCPVGVRAAGYHNYLLNNSEHRNKYQLLKSGEKTKFYYSLDPHCDVFAYSAGDFPYEFAPKIDYETQFEKTILDPINRVLVAMGFKGFNKNLIYVTSIF